MLWPRLPIEDRVNSDQYNKTGAEPPKVDTKDEVLITNVSIFGGMNGKLITGKVFKITL